MTYRAEFNEKRGWRVIADYRSVGGEAMDVCGAIDGRVAAETAFRLNEARPS